MQQVTQSHSCRLEARDESEEEQDTLAHPQATNRERQRRGRKKKKEEEGGGRMEEVLGSVRETVRKKKKKRTARVERKNKLRKRGEGRRERSHVSLN